MEQVANPLTSPSLSSSPLAPETPPTISSSSPARKPPPASNPTKSVERNPRIKTKPGLPKQASSSRLGAKSGGEKKEGKVRRMSRRMSSRIEEKLSSFAISVGLKEEEILPPHKSEPPKKRASSIPPPQKRDSAVSPPNEVKINRKKNLLRTLTGDDSDVDSKEENDNFPPPQTSLEKSFSFKEAIKNQSSFSNDELREGEKGVEIPENDNFEDIEFNDPSKVEAEWVPGNDSDSDEDDNFDLFKTSLIDLDLLGPPKLDHRFHWFFAVVLHILSSGVTYFSINYALYPDNLKYELMCKLLTPYSILAVCLVMLGTDNIDPRLDLEGGLTFWDFSKTIRRSPNLAFSVLSILIQRSALCHAAFAVGKVKRGVGGIFTILVMIPAGRILYRQRVKMAVTVADDTKQDLPAERASARKRINSKGSGANLSRGLSRASTANMDNSHIHAENYEKLRLTETKFKNLVLTEMPKIGFATFLTVAYFSFDAYGCLDRVQREEEDWKRTNEGKTVNYCYARITDPETCTQTVLDNEECMAGPGECEDIVHSSETFSLLFVIFAILKIYAQPLANLRYNPVHLMQFDMLFRDQIQILLFFISGGISLLIFASSDEIQTSDWCSYVNPNYGDREGEDMFGKRSRTWRLAANNATKFLFFCVIVIMGMTKDEQKVSKNWLGKMAHWLHMRMKTRDPLSVAPVMRAGMYSAAVGICLFVSFPFVYFATRALLDGTATSSFARLAENMYAVFLSTWTILFCSVGLFFMSRPRSKERKKKIVYLMLPLQSLLMAVGCYIMSHWEVKAGMMESERKFFRNSLNNLFIFVLTVVFYPVVKKCFKILSDDNVYSEREVQGHISNLFVQAAALLAPACFLFAEGTGCIHANSYRGCYALVESNFTVQVHLILSYGYFLLFGFTIHRFTFDDILNFTAPASLIVQFTFISLSSMLAFAVFGMRPRDIDDNEVMDGLVDCGRMTKIDATPLDPYDDVFNCTGTASSGEQLNSRAPPQFAMDATHNMTQNCQYIIFSLWAVNYFAQGFFVHREDQKVDLNTLPERSRRTHRSDHVLEDALVKKEAEFAHKLEHVYRVVKGDHDIRISKVFNDIAVVPVVFSFGLVVYLFFSTPVPELSEEYKDRTKYPNPTAEMYYNSTAHGHEDEVAGYWYGVWLGMSDLSHCMAVLACFSNLNQNTTRRRRALEVAVVFFLSFECVIAGLVPAINLGDSVQGIMFVLAFLLFTGVLLVLKAKDALVKNYSPTELKKHIMKMAIVTFTQLSPIIFLQTEYIGCITRAFYDNDQEKGHPDFSPITVGDGSYCGRIRLGTKSVTFQLCLMLVMAWANGVFTKYSEDELTVENISRLKMSYFNVYQLSMFMTTSMLCLYLFGTRGKSTIFYTAEQGMGGNGDYLLVIYFMWWILIMSDVGRRLYQLYSDEKFMEDLQEEKQQELVEINDPTVKPKLRARKSVWDLQSVASAVNEDDELKAHQENDKKLRKVKIEKARTSKFKRVRKRKSEDNEGFFDFSPGML